MLGMGTWCLSSAWASPAEGEDDGETPVDRPQIEWAAVPFAGGDTDIGFGVGAVGSVARLHPEHDPFRWRLELSAFAAVRGEQWEPTYQDFFANFSMLDLMGGRLRLQIRPSYTLETTLIYFGLGNASEAPEETVRERDFFEWRHPALVARARWDLGGGWLIGFGGTYTINWITVRPGSTLAEDMASADPVLSGLLGDGRDHGRLLAEATLFYDSRDDELAPSRGYFHHFTARVSPRLGESIPYAYQELALVLHGYQPLGTPRLVLAGRLVGDMLLGDPPFYQLGRYLDTAAVGGIRGVRGVPAYRYYGKHKAFGNLELRAQLFDFHLFARDFNFGVVTFFDAGRVWTNFDSPTRFDGEGLGIHWGTGFGIRLQQGRSFILRADLAWSPDARPIGGYLTSGQTFDMF